MARHHDDPNEPKATPRQRFGFPDKATQSAHRFMSRGMSTAVIRGNTALKSDPLRSQGRSALAGLGVATLLVVGAAAWGFIKPAGVTGNDQIFSVRPSNEKYVLVNDRLHRVTNLTSARLIIGQPANIATVSEKAIAKYARGPIMGISGVPDQITATRPKDEWRWSACDEITPNQEVELTAIAGPLSLGAASAQPLQADTGVLVSFEGKTYLIVNGVRAQLDLSNRAALDALGLGSTPLRPRAVTRGMLNAIPLGPELAAPPIAGGGSKPSYDLGERVVVGSVVESVDVGGGRSNYVILRDGVQKVNDVVAAMIRNSNSFGSATPVTVSPDRLASVPRVSSLRVEGIPAKPVQLVDQTAKPVLCSTWSRGVSSTVSSRELLIGSTLPLTSDQIARRVTMVTGNPDRGVASSVYVPAGSGWYVFSTGNDAAAATTEAQWWVSDAGVRYGLEDSGSEASSATSTTQGQTAASALGLSNPGAAPWSILSLFPAGPTLSKKDALTAHDTWPIDPNPGVVDPNSNRK